MKGVDNFNPLMYNKDEQRKGEMKILNIVIKDINFDKSYYLI